MIFPVNLRIILELKELRKLKNPVALFSSSFNNAKDLKPRLTIVRLLYDHVETSPTKVNLLLNKPKVEK